MSRGPLGVPGPLERFDERDSVFSRARLRPGTDEYESYYGRRPENRSADDRTRDLSNLASPGTGRYRPVEAALVEALFSASDLVAAETERAERGRQRTTPSGLGAEPEGGTSGHDLGDRSPAELAHLVKEAALFLGADDAGVAELDPGFVYSHRGRPLERFGEPIALGHARAVVLVFAMRHRWVLAGPEMASTAETAHAYQRAAAATFALAEALERLGMPSRAHVDSSYLVICPPLAVAAGLGELGRNGILVHRTYGPGVRLGIVTTSADIEAGSPVSFGVADFCRVCAKCARNCPASAISDGEPEVVRGAVKWPIVPERCYHYWRTQGTDCGVCIRSCPFAKPDTAIHRLVRGVVRRSTAFDRALLWADDLFYGAEPGPVKPPLLEIGPPRRTGGTPAG